MVSIFPSKKKYKIANIIVLIQCLTLLAISSCKKLVEVNAPTTSISAKNVYTNDLTASAVLTGIYTRMSMNNLIGADLTSIGFTTGLVSDELTLYDGSGDTRLRNYYQNNLNAKSPEFWGPLYNEIYILNSAIEGLNNSNTLTALIKKQLLGEAKFMRAFCYFYLINLHGDAPLILGTDYTKNSVMSRNPQKEIWQQIISDLINAKSQLSTDYLDGSLSVKTTERVRPTKWAAIALLARSYLYTNDWQNAEAQSTEIINNSNTFMLDSLHNIFLMNSKESIWQLQPVNYGSNTEDAKIYILPETGPSASNPVYLSTQLVGSFEANDNRKKIWIDTISVSGVRYYFAAKYKVYKLNASLTEYNTVLRLGEQLLLRAEARAQQNNLEGGRSDLNIIRKRSGLKEINIVEKQSLLQAIYHERQVELFTEWGHRWLDLKRTNLADKTMMEVTPKKGGLWNTNWQLFPIPSFDILYDGNLTQNAGY
jgi:hypothetical protein